MLRAAYKTGYCSHSYTIQIELWNYKLSNDHKIHVNEPLHFSEGKEIVQNSKKKKNKKEIEKKRSKNFP